jgi:hypothetical protein
MIKISIFIELEIICFHQFYAVIDKKTTLYCNETANVIIKNNIFYIKCLLR